MFLTATPWKDASLHLLLRVMKQNFFDGLNEKQKYVGRGKEMQKAKKIRNWTRATAVLLSAVLLVTGTCFASGNEIHGVLLSWPGNAATTMTVSWRGAAETNCVLQVVPQTTYDQSKFTEAAEYAAACKDISLDGSGAWHYEATAADLLPGTAYVYRVGREGVWSDVETFTSADPDAKTLTFAYMGDVQPANDSEAEFALWGELAQAMVERNPELTFAILGGDIVNSGISLEQFDLFASNAENVFSAIPLLATPGNHESNFIGGKPELYLDYFAFPQNGPEGFEEEIYSFDVANCHILSLNSWIFSGEQPLSEADYERVNNWIEYDLITSDADWQIVVTHIPVYAVHSDTTSTKVKENWAPIFERCGVDLVFVGHQHVYSRSYPMYEGKVDYENGIPYIMGVSGSKFYSSADETFAERTIYNTANYQLVQIDGDTLTVQTLDAEGNELDWCNVQQREVSMTRGEYMEILWHCAGSSEAGVSPFTDSQSTAVTWAYEAGLVLGYGNGCFGPDDPMEGWHIEIMIERLARSGGIVRGKDRA